VGEEVPTVMEVCLRCWTVWRALETLMCGGIMSSDLHSQSREEKVRSLYFKYRKEIGMASDSKQIRKKDLRRHWRWRGEFYIE